ncbi:hypothetical protein CPB85DRAFT_1254933 [Mucidula mucida]|nr:hypothetical protein CPB85DRAFT_1254933 [Mucidula mucida]
MHIQNPEYCWLVVGIINASLLWMVALWRIPHYEANYWLASILGVAGVLNLATSLLRYHDDSFLSTASTCVLFLAGTAAFVGAIRVHHAIEMEAAIARWEASARGEKTPNVQCLDQDLKETNFILRESIVSLKV